MIAAVGVDLVSIDRIRTVWQRHGERFLQRCFDPTEVALALARHDPAATLAARFAAKEAFQKTWPKRLRWRDVAVENDAAGAPTLAFRDRVLAGDMMGYHAHLSISHERDHAVAFVVLEVRSRRQPLAKRRDRPG